MACATAAVSFIARRGSFPTSCLKRRRGNAARGCVCFIIAIRPRFYAAI